MNNLDLEYYHLIKRIYNNGIKEFNKRTKTEILTLLHESLIFELEEEIYFIGGRKIYPHIAAAEVAWSILGSKKTDLINKYSKMWKDFEDVPGEVSTAYGYRWQTYFGRNQLEDAIKSLELDSSSRQVWVTAWDPGKDGLLNIGKNKNVPCPVGFSLNILNNKLNMAVYMRSSDAIVGLPYDIAFYSLLLVIISNSLNIKPNKLCFYLNNVHIYKNYYNIAKNLIINYEKYLESYKLEENGYIPLKIDKFDDNINSIKNSPEIFINSIKEKAKQNRNIIKAYNPNIEVIV